MVFLLTVSESGGHIMHGSRPARLSLSLVCPMQESAARVLWLDLKGSNPGNRTNDSQSAMLDAVYWVRRASPFVNIAVSSDEPPTIAAGDWLRTVSSSSQAFTCRKIRGAEPSGPGRATCRIKWTTRTTGMVPNYEGSVGSDVLALRTAILQNTLSAPHI